MMNNKIMPIILEKPGIGKITLPGLDCKKATADIVDGIVKYLQSTGADGIVVGLSGGVDSSLTAALCHKAAVLLNGRFHALIMPSEENSQEDQRLAEKLALKLGLEKRERKHLAGCRSGYSIVPIDDIKDAVNNMLGLEGVAYENMQSRIRMLLLYGMKESAPHSRVAGTGNRDEDFGLGYFTKYGDGGVDFSPIAMLSKRLVRAMAAYNKIPAEIVTKKPTAGLRKGQTDRQDLGCSYFQAEVIVAGNDDGHSRKMILEIAKYPEGHDVFMDEKMKKQLSGITGEMIEDVLFRHEKLAPHKLEAPPVILTTAFI